MARTGSFSIFLILLWLVGMVGCSKSNNDDSSGSTDPDTETASDNYTDSNSDSDADSDSDSDSDNDSDGDIPTEGDTDTACGNTTVPFEPVIPTVLLLVDRSGSMKQPIGGQNPDNLSRWDVARDALINGETGFIKMLESEMRFGLAMYAGEDENGQGQCPYIEMVDPQIDNFDEIESVYSTSEPIRNTPTPDSIRVITDMLLADTDDSPKIIVLVTDGFPDTCASPDSQDAAAMRASVDAVAAAFEKGIATYVISVDVAANDTTGHFQDLADAGAGVENAPYYPTSSADELSAAFEDIIYGLRKCTYDLEGFIDEGQETECDVKFVHTDNTESIFAYDETNGWQSSLAEDGNSSQITLNGEACETIKRSNGELKVNCPCGAFGPDVE